MKNLSFGENSHKKIGGGGRFGRGEGVRVGGGHGGCE